MTLTELRYVVAVARERHFGRAAEACHVSQPTLSVGIRKLEDELGVKLFERGTSEVTVTPAGERIVEQAREVIEQTNLIRELAKQGRDPLAGPLRVGIIYTIGPYLLPGLVRRMIAEIPQMPLILQENFTVNLLESLRQGELDVAILAEPFAHSGLVTRAVYDEPFVVALPRGHAWARRKSLATGELASETMLLLGTGHCFRDHVLEICPELLRLPASPGAMRRTFEGSSLETIRHMVAEGIGITVMPGTARAKGDDDAFLAYVPFRDPVPSRRVSLAWRRSFPRAAAIDALHAAIQSSGLEGVSMLRDAPAVAH